MNSFWFRFERSYFFLGGVIYLSWWIEASRFYGSTCPIHHLSLGNLVVTTEWFIINPSHSFTMYSYDLCLRFWFVQLLSCSNGTSSSSFSSFSISLSPQDRLLYRLLKVLCRSVSSTYCMDLHIYTSILYNYTMHTYICLYTPSFYSIVYKSYPLNSCFHRP